MDGRTGRLSCNARAGDTFLADCHFEPGRFRPQPLVADIVERGGIGLGTAFRRLSPVIGLVCHGAFSKERDVGWRRPQRGTMGTPPGGQGRLFGIPYSAGDRFAADGRPRLSFSSS